MADGYAYSTHEPEPLEKFLVAMPRPAHGQERAMPRARRVPAPKASARAALLAANPWLTEEDLGTGKRKAGKRMPRVAAPDEPPGGDPADDSDSSDTPDDPPPLPPPLGAPQGMEVGEADAEMVVHEDPGPAPPALLELRREFWWEDQERMHFYTRFLGGWWTLAHRGVECERIAGLARAHAESWCDIYGFPKEKTFTFRVYGRDGSIKLAREFARRANYYYLLMVDSGLEYDFEYTQEIIDTYEYELDYLNWVTELANDDPCFEKALAIRDTKPRFGPCQEEEEE